MTTITILNQCKKNGFTLLETVIAATLAMIVGILMIGILSNNTSLFSKENTIVNSGLNSNDSSSFIYSQIKQASSIASGYPESSPIYVSSSDVLVLKFLSISSTGVISNTYDYGVIAQDSSNPAILRFQLFPDPSSIRKPKNQVLTTILKNINFQYLDNNGSVVPPDQASEVGVNIVISSSVGSIGTDSTSSATIRLRNF